MFEEKRPVSQHGTPPNGEFGGDHGHGSRDLQRRARELEIVAQVASEAATELDVNRLLWSVANLTKERFALYHAHIYLLDSSGENLVLKAGAGKIGEQMVAEGRVISIHHPHSLVASAARSRQGILSNDVTQTVDFLPHPLLPETRSELALPMIARGELVGVLDVQAERISAFDDEDVRLKAVLAAQVAIAVQNAQTFERMERTQEAYARVYDNSIDLIGTAGLSDGFFKSLNPAWEATLGWTVEELMAQPYVTFVHPDDVEATNREAGEQLGRGLKTISFQNRYRTRDGAYRWLAWNSTPDIPNDLIYFVARDITDQKLAQAALDDRSKELADIKFALDEHAIVAITDQTGKITYVNDKFTQISEYSTQELLGQDHRIINSGYHSKEFIRNVWVTIANGGVWKGEFLNRAKSGRLYWVDTTIVPFLNAQGKPYQYVAIRYDITSRKQAEETVQRHALEMETVAEVSAATSTILDTEYLLQSVVDLTKERFNLYHAHIYLLNEQADMLVLAAGAGSAGRTMVERRHTIPLNREHSLVARAARSRIPVIVNDVTQTLDFLPNALLPNTKSEMAIPMIVGDTMIGVLDVQSEQLGRFTSDDEQVQGALAAQIAVAVQNARQYQLAQRRLRFTQASNRISELARTEGDLETTLAQILEEIVTVFGADTSVFSLLSRNDERWHGFVGAGGSMTTAIAKTFVDDAERYPHALEALQQSDVVAIDDSAQYPKFPADYIERVGIKSVLTLPIFAAEEMTGAIFVNYGANYHTFTADEIELARGFVNQITATIQRRLAEQQVQLYADVAANSPIGIYVYRLDDMNDDRSLRLMAANPASEAATGVKPETIVGKTMAEAFPGLMETQIPAIYANIVRTGQLVELGEIEYGDENVEKGVFYVRGFPLPNQSVGISFENITERKRQQEALRASQEELQAILDNATAVVYVKGRDGRYITVNRTYERLFHVRREDMLGKTDYDIFPKEAADAFRAVDIQVWEEGKTLELEEHAPTDDGLRTYISVKFPLRDASGEVYAMCGISTDITERKLAENEVAERSRDIETVAQVGTRIASTLDVQELLWSVANLTKENFNRYHAHIYLLDDAGHNLVLTAGAGEVGRQLVARGHSIPLDRPGSLVARAARSRKVTVVNAVRQDPDFLPNDLLPETRAEMAVPILYGDQLLGVLDIQDRVENAFSTTNEQVKQALANQIAVALVNARTFEQMQIAQADFTRIFDNSIDLIGTAGLTDGMFKSLNPAWEVTLGWTLDELMSKPYIEFTHPEDIERTNREASEQLGKGYKTLSFENRYITRDGDYRWLSWNSTPDIPNSLIYFVARDVTEQKLSETIIRQARTRAELLATTNAELSQAADEQGILKAIMPLLANNPPLLASFMYADAREDEHIEALHVVALASGEGQALPLTMLPTLDYSRAEFPLVNLLVATGNELLVVGDFTKDNRIGDNLMGYIQQLGLGAAIIIPFRSGNTWQGLMAFNWNSPQDFSLEQQELLYAVLPTANAVIASRRAYLAEEQARRETEAARQRAEQVAAINAALSQASNEQELLAAVIPLMKETPPTLGSLGYVSVNDNGEITNVDIVALSTGDGQPIALEFLPTRHLTADEFPLLNVILDNPDEVVFLADFANELHSDDPLLQYAQQLNLGASVVLPIKSGQVWQAIMSFSWGTAQQFSAEQREVLSAVQPTANAAVTSRRAYLAEEQARRESERRASELTTVARVSAATTTILDLEQLLQSVSDLTKESFKLYHTHIYLYDPERQLLVLAAGAGEAGRVMKEHGHSIPYQRETSIVATAARSRQAVLVNDVTRELNFMPNPLLPETRSELAVPLVVGDELIGVLDVQSEQIGRFTQADALIKGTLAGQIAVAVNNARAFEHEQQTVQQLRELDRLKQQFLANMSHELRTPLNSIIGYSEVLLDGVDGDLTEDAVEDVNAIHMSGKHLLAIINDILDLAKIEAGQMYLERKPVELEGFLSELVRTNQILVKDKPVELLLERVDALVTDVHADPIRLRQIMMNLVSNAVKFTEEGSVTVRFGQADAQQAYIEVQDTGIGIKAEDLPVIFEQFRQVDGSSTRRAGGTGLGLTITRHFIMMHGGDISAESEYGVGTKMRFTLPLYAAETV